MVGLKCINNFKRLCPRSVFHPSDPEKNGPETVLRSGICSGFVVVISVVARGDLIALLLSWGGGGGAGGHSIPFKKLRDWAGIQLV